MILFPILHVLFIAIVVFCILSLICVSVSLLFCNIYPRYLISLTSSMLFSFHFHSFFFVLLLPFSNTIIFDLSRLRLKHFLSRNLLNLFIISFNSAFLLTSNTILSGYIIVQNFFCLLQHLLYLFHFFFQFLYVYVE